MDNLSIYELYQKSNSKRINEFNKYIDSSYLIETNYEKKESDFEWLEIMEITIRYLDNILRNPNRFIVNEEEIVNIEKARRTTVESIKHLAKHTNYIQKIEDNGDVKPSKILNINNDESFNTYENRFIYTLIQNMSSFIALKKKNLILESSLKNNKKCAYKGVSKVGIEQINIELTMNSSLISKEKNGYNNEGKSPLERVEKIEQQINDLTNTAVYKCLARLHVARVIPPIKKTNLILKNVNFQYAMRLWDYLQMHTANEDKSVKRNIKYEDDLELKKLLDDIFLLNYLTLNSVDENQDIISQKNKKEIIDKLTNDMIQKIIEINSNLSIEELKSIIGEKIAIVKNKKEASISEIQNKIQTKIQSYLDRIESFRF